MTKDEARKELLETLEEYCHDRGYGLQTFAGLSALVYTLYPLQKTMTNADKIRGMTDNELADYFESIIDCWQCPAYKGCTQEDGCANALLGWLKQEYKRDDND